MKDHAISEEEPNFLKRMKNFRTIFKLTFVAILSVAITACDDDEESASADFASIASTYEEPDAGTVTIPLRNAGNVGALDVDLGGTAVEGEDYTVDGITQEGVNISIIDDNKLEGNETIRVKLTGAGLSGNLIHTITVLSNCEDTEGLALDAFNGDYTTSYKIGSTVYTPYHEELEADEEDETLLWTLDFFAEPIEAYIKVDLAAGTAYFPDQDAGGYAITESSGTVTYDLCAGTATFTIDLLIDGDPWTFTYVR
jgi:hypothetical protein